MNTAGTELKHVWQPLDIGPTRVKHRVMSTAMTMLYGESYLLSDRHIAFYRERAKGGAALLITEQQAGHPLSTGSFQRGCTAWDTRAIPQYAKLADAVHEFGARQFVQLFAAGVHDRGTNLLDEWHPLWGVSRIPSIAQGEVPMVMDREQIRAVVTSFAKSASNVRAAGLDGVEIHGAHSYLIGQFFSRTYNTRTDAYGGSIENRSRLALEIAEAIRDSVGDDLSVGLRFSFDEFLGSAGLHPEESEEILAHLADSSLLDFFNISGGGYHTFHLSVAPMHGEEGFMVPFARQAKAVIGEAAKVFIVGRILDVGMADEIVGSGAADMVAMTRAQLADPYLVRKSNQGRQSEVVRCVGANVCLRLGFDERSVTCVLNPAAGREAMWGDGTLRRAADARRVIVVGGGPAGLKAAAVAAARGHHVTLLEADAEVGGHLRLHRRLPRRSRWDWAIEDLRSAADRSGVEIEVGRAGSAELVAALESDIVVCATGSTYDVSGLSAYRPDRDGIPGADTDLVADVATATQRALKEPLSLGDRVLILDESGEYLPLGLAEILANAGVRVEVMTPHLHVGAEVHKTMDWFHIAPLLAEHGVKFTAQHFVERVEDRGVIVYDLWGKQPVLREVDSLVLSLYRVADDATYQALQGSDAEVRKCGDAVAPRPLEAVLFEAELTGREI